MSFTTKTVSVEFFKGFIKAVKQGGYDPKAILIAAGIAPDLLDTPSSRIDGVQLHRLLSIIQLKMNDLYMGFCVQRYKPKLNTAVINMAIKNETLGELTRVSSQYREAVRDDVHYGFLVDKKNHEFCFALSGFDLFDNLDSHLFYWLRLSTIYRYQSWLIGRKIKLNCVNFSTPEPECGVDHLAMFNCDVHFNQAESAILYDSKYLAYPIIRSESEFVTNTLKMDTYEDWFEVAGNDLSVAHQVERVIENLQKEDVFHPTISVVAKQLRVNPRSLRNQLSRENENFQQIKAKVRQALAIKKLISTALPVSTVAIELGFTEPGDFSRNFKRWTGFSPSEYRAKHSQLK